jgi:hypothetical protein
MYCYFYQASKFVARFHQERKDKLTLILDSECWKQADVPPEFQVLADTLDSTGKEKFFITRGKL